VSYLFDNTASVLKEPALRLVPPMAPLAPAQDRNTERMLVAYKRIQQAAENGERMRAYEVALDVDMSEFHFARQFRLLFGVSPHAYYDELRAKRARRLLAQGQTEGEVARAIGFRRPAELRALLSKR
jgi:transcriptional regulator GlxA family with amidase domain